MGTRPQGIAWLGLAGLSAACLALTALRVAEYFFDVPAQALWSLCCQSAERLSQVPTSAWLRAGLLAAVLGLLVLAATNLGVRLVKTQRFIGQILSNGALSPLEIDPVVHELGLRGRIRVAAFPEPIAFCYGILRLRICVSTALVQTLSPSELTAVLLHERHHLKQRHPLRTLVLESLADTFFFLPAVGELRDLQLAKMELEADQAAIRGVGRKPLASALHRMLTHSEPSGPHPRLAFSGLNVTQARIDQILDGTSLPRRTAPSGIASAAASVLLICLLLMSLTG